MIHEYLYEIITAIVALTSIVIFILIKQGQSKSSYKVNPTKSIESDEEINHRPKNTKIKPKYDAYDTDAPQESVEIEEVLSVEETPVVQEDKSVKIDDYDTLNGKSEGSFGTDESEVETVQPQKENKRKIQKRELIQHGKITKQNFSEFAGERILVAEDNMINQKVITGLLAGSGIDVVLADDGQEALDILKKDTNFVMILMDAHMPRIDGFEATRAIRKTPEYDHILVVALSGDTASDDIAKMKAAGMEEQLEKPLRMNDLYDIFYMYSGHNNEEDNEDFVEVIMTKELNGDKGLTICGGDEDFYNSILDEFIQTYEGSTDELGDLLRSDELSKADKILLDIIGVTANIGADPLNAIAQDLKAALTDTTEKSYLTLIDQYKVHLINLIKDIKER